MSVGVNVVGLTAANAYLKKKKLQVSAQEKLGIRQAAIHVQGEVKMSIAGQRSETKSVDTGRFLNSVDIVSGDEDAIIFSDLSYSKGLEFGYGSLKPRLHFNNTKSRTKQKVVEIIQNNINKI